MHEADREFHAIIQARHFTRTAACCLLLLVQAVGIGSDGRAVVHFGPAGHVQDASEALHARRAEFLQMASSDGLIDRESFTAFMMRHGIEESLCGGYFRAFSTNSRTPDRLNASQFLIGLAALDFDALQVRCILSCFSAFSINITFAATRARPVDATRRWPLRQLACRWPDRDGRGNSDPPCPPPGGLRNVQR